MLLRLRVIQNLQTNIRKQDSNYSLKLFGVHPPIQIGKFIFTEKIHVAMSDGMQEKYILTYLT